MKHLGDITLIHGDEIEPVDVISGGSPCQDVSVAGLGKGLEGSRSRLFFDMIRIIKEMRANDIKHGRTNDAIRPRFMVFENVPGLFGSNGGEDFRVVLESIVRIVEPSADVPRPSSGGGVDSFRGDCGRRMVSRLEASRCKVLGSRPKKKTFVDCRRFWK